MKNRSPIQRILEIIPGTLSWGIILVFIFLAVLHPVFCAVLIIVFNFYWIIRTLYLTTLLIMAHRKLAGQKNRDWLADCRSLEGQNDWRNIYHLIIFPVYKEGPDILRASLEALKACHYPKEKMVVVVAFEERNPEARKNAQILENEFKNGFFEYMSTFHPAGIPGESPTKGANATWAAKKGKEFFDGKNIPYDKVVVSCFDADTCADQEYFGCLAYHFVSTPNPHQASYQPMPVYNNNIWYAPSFARVVETSASYWQLIESMRLEKFVTFSSHSMSFKTLVDIDYWPVDMISDDSVVYWKAYLYFKGQYRVIPLYITVSMDIAFAKGLLKTIAVQYKQKRRWAWGIENFPFVFKGFLKDNVMPFSLKMRRSYHLLEGHVLWAVWAVIIVFMPSLPVLFGGAVFSQMSAIGYNLPRITGLLLNSTLIATLIWIVLSRTTLPKRPEDVKWTKNIVMVAEWFLVPFIVLILGSTPALDAQTRLMLGRYMKFEVTEKNESRRQKINP